MNDQELRQRLGMHRIRSAAPNSGVLSLSHTPETGEQGIAPVETIGVEASPGTFDSPDMARPYRTPPRPYPPRFNISYDSMRLSDTTGDIIDGVLSGSFTPTAGALVSQQLKLASGGSPVQPLGQYPGALQMYLCIRTFSYAPEAGTATGNYAFIVRDASGAYTVPLGVYPAGASGSGQVTMNLLLPAPYTDPTKLLIGTLECTMVGATPVVLDYQIGYAWVYLIPQLIGYGPGEDDDTWRR